MLHKPQVFYLNKGFPILLLVLTSLNFISSPLHLFQLDLTIYTKMRTFAFNANLSQTSSFGNQNNLHGASFSSYLNHTEENFLRKLTGSTQSRSSIISVTPSVQSDPSWNSQSVLLYSSGRIQKQRNPKTSTGKNLLAKFGCRCYYKNRRCSSTKHFLLKNIGRARAFSLETMLNWDPTHSPRVEGTETNDDMASETSSDLFEIESFSTNRYAYAPSEASIEWSVVTASATRNKGKEIQKQHCRPGILLGCNFTKSVRQL